MHFCLAYDGTGNDGIIGKPAIWKPQSVDYLPVLYYTSAFNLETQNDNPKHQNLNRFPTILTTASDMIPCTIPDDGLKAAGVNTSSDSVV